MSSSAQAVKTEFWKLQLPTGEAGYLPADIKLEFPQDAPVSKERLHLLAYIPWDDKYLQRVPDELRPFFQSILPRLGARTTNVHTATCLGLVGELIEASGAKVDERVVKIALALHDSGWSKVSQEEIANSLDYSGLAASGEADIAVRPKELHDAFGAEIAKQVADTYRFDPALTAEQKHRVVTLVRNHTWPQRYHEHGQIPLDLQLVADADRLWSYTHENFWQDTIRKNVKPPVYAHNLEAAVQGYFLTDAGRAKARELMVDRVAEVAAWADRY